MTDSIENANVADVDNSVRSHEGSDSAPTSEDESSKTIPPPPASVIVLHVCKCQVPCLRHAVSSLRVGIESRRRSRDNSFRLQTFREAVSKHHAVLRRDVSRQSSLHVRRGAEHSAEQRPLFGSADSQGAICLHRRRRHFFDGGRSKLLAEFYGTTSKRLRKRLAEPESAHGLALHSLRQNVSCRHSAGHGPFANAR